MNKRLMILAVLVWLMPASVLAATEFELGGFIKLNTFWDSTQEGLQPSGSNVIQRNNDALFHHGQFLVAAQESRFNLTVKGPKLWGATTKGFIEVDFLALRNNNFSSVSGAVTQPSSTNAFIPRLRHAWFSLSWPETELLFGQTFGMLAEYTPEVAGDTEFAALGVSDNRVPQIRLTQKFLGAWTVAGALCKPYDPAGADVNFTGSLPAGSFGNQLNTGLEGRSSEIPQFQGKLAYQQPLWGYAANMGKPQGFTAQLAAAWQRSRYRNNFTAASLNTFGQNAFGTATVLQNGQQYLNPWIVQGTLFIPVLPTYSPKLAGTASLTAQWYVGQGVSLVGSGRDNDNSWLDFSGINNAGQLLYDRKLTNQFGGFIQGQYYFTNQWFLNLVWGMSRNYGFDRGTSASLASLQPGNPGGFKYASNNDQLKIWQQFDVTLWYQPVKALKFGWQYAYERCDFLQNLNNPALNAAGSGVGTQTNGVQPSAGSTNWGASHRVEFVAIMYF